MVFLAVALTFFFFLSGGRGGYYWSIGPLKIMLIGALQDNPCKAQLQAGWTETPLPNNCPLTHLTTWRRGGGRRCREGAKGRGLGATVIVASKQYVKEPGFTNMNNEQVIFELGRGEKKIRKKKYHFTLPSKLVKREEYIPTETSLWRSRFHTERCWSGCGKWFTIKRAIKKESVFFSSKFNKNEAEGPGRGGERTRVAEEREGKIVMYFLIRDGSINISISININININQHITSNVIHH